MEAFDSRKTTTNMEKSTIATVAAIATDRFLKPESIHLYDDESNLSVNLFLSSDFTLPFRICLIYVMKMLFASNNFDMMVFSVCITKKPLVDEPKPVNLVM